MTEKFTCPGCGNEYATDGDEFTCPLCNIVLSKRTPRSQEESLAVIGSKDPAQPKRRQKPSPVVRLEFILVLAFLFLAIFWMSWPRFGVHPPGADNESSAISTLRTLSSVQSQYEYKYGRYAALSELCNAGLIDGNLVTAITPDQARWGYYYVVFRGKDCWSVVAAPAEPGKSGRRSFYMDSTGVIHYAGCATENAAVAGPDSPRIGE